VASSSTAYNGAVYHGGGENHSDGARRGINITYNVSWLRQRLTGCRQGAYVLGYIDDLRDPISVLRDDAGTDGFGGDIDLEARVETMRNS
jgi:hypothetical protein